jgi:hypothetical protein
MEPEGSLPHSQEPATCPYPDTIILWIWKYDFYVREKSTGLPYPWVIWVLSEADWPRVYWTGRIL